MENEKEVMKRPAVVEGTELELKNIAESRLTKWYGNPRDNVTPGLHWLLGRDALGFPWYLDHPEYRIKDGKKTITARPYGLGLEDMSSLVDLARKKGLYLYIQAPSNYNTGTVVVVLTERKPNE